MTAAVAPSCFRVDTTHQTEPPHPPDRVLIENRVNGATTQSRQRCRSDRWRPPICGTRPPAAAIRSMNQPSILQTSRPLPQGANMAARIQLRPSTPADTHSSAGRRQSTICGFTALPAAPPSPSADRTGNRRRRNQTGTECKYLVGRISKIKTRAIRQLFAELLINSQGHQLPKTRRRRLRSVG
jgi:hypothetical protein